MGEAPDKGRARGRPTLLDPEMRRELTRAAGAGLPWGLVAAHHGIHPATLRRWRRTDPGLRTALDRARVRRVALAEAERWSRATGVDPFDLVAPFVGDPPPPTFARARAALAARRQAEAAARAEALAQLLGRRPAND